MHLANVRTSVLAVAAALFISAPGWGQRTPRLTPVNERITAPLLEAGVDPKNERALVGALQRSGEVPCYAAMVLGSRPGNPAVDEALLQLARPPKGPLTDWGELHMDAAVYALARHGDFRWADDAAKRMPTIREPMVRLRLAGYLAVAGRYDGWSLIRSTITTKQPSEGTVKDALLQVQYFEGMKDESGKPVNLAEELDKMRQVAPIEYRGMILAAMPRVSSQRRIQESQQRTGERKQ